MCTYRFINSEVIIIYMIINLLLCDQVQLLLYKIIIVMDANQILNILINMLIVQFLLALGGGVTSTHMLLKNHS